MNRYPMRLSRLPAVVFAVLVCLPGAAPVKAADGVKVWVLPPMTRVRPDTPPGGELSVKLSAARNEYEPFQIAIRAGNEKITGITAAAGDLVSRRGFRIAADNIRLYREHFVYLRRPSYRSPEAPGWWPDALIPFVDPYSGEAVGPYRRSWVEVDGERVRKITGGRFHAVPFDLWPDQTGAIWCDVYVPADTRADDGYRGEIVIKTEGAEPARVAIDLTVWDFELPAGPTSETEFGGFYRLDRYHGVEQSSKEYWDIYLRYARALADHRINPPIPGIYRPQVTSDGGIDPSAADESLKRYLSEYNVTGFRIPNPPFDDITGGDRAKAVRYFRSWARYLRSQDLLDRAYTYLIDEPNDKEAYERVRELAAVVHEADPDLRFMCTEQSWPQDREWGSLTGAVDIWCPLFPLFDSAAGAAALKRGEALWTYTALCQTPRGPEGQSRGETPFWQIDFPLLNYRIPLWINRRFGISGLLYWETAHWWGPERDPWTDPAFRVAYNGEGFLLYPGSDAGIDGPVGSIRLKAVREGLEDYEYFALLEAKGGGKMLEEMVAGIARDWTDWETDPDGLAAARRRLAMEIVRRTPKRR